MYYHDEEINDVVLLHKLLEYLWLLLLGLKEFHHDVQHEQYEHYVNRFQLNIRYLLLFDFQHEQQLEYYMAMFQNLINYKSH